ncbi:hypothetical protein C0J52_17088 [Blattella germanica]|nr:hypothetical protein C0J52_17088 [Blattella germanica]
MANFYDEVNVCDHQYSGRINPLSEDNLLLEDETRSSLPLLGNNDEPATFCVRCRSLSNSSNYMTGLETEMRNPAGLSEWDSRINNGYHDTVLNSSLAPQYLITSDGADMPLLTDGEGYGNVTVNPSNNGIDDLDHCHVLSSSYSSSGAWRQLLAATIMCLIFMVAEVVGGYLAGSLAVMTDAAHLLSDFVGFLVSLFAVWLGRRPPTRRLSFGYHRAAKLADPVCTFLFSVVVLATTIPVLRDTSHVLMEGFPRHLDYALIANNLCSVEGVRAVHSLHVWSLTLNKNALSVHLAVDPVTNTDLVLRQALCLIRRKFDIQHATVQVERYCAATMQHCLQCQVPKE